MEKQFGTIVFNWNRTRCCLFFNHFGGRKITEDPTPMEVEMRVYEDDVNKTLIEQEKRKERK